MKVADQIQSAINRRPCEWCDGLGESPFGGICSICLGKGNYPFKTVEEMLDWIFIIPPTWACTDFARAFVWMKRAHSIGWSFRDGTDPRFLCVRKPGSTDYHPTDGMTCNCLARLYGADSCSHSDLTKGLGPIEASRAVASQFKLVTVDSKP